MVSSCVEVLQSRTDEFVPEVEIETTSSSLVALDMLAARPCDLLITDLRMAGMDGVELLKRARKLSPDLAVVIITAYPTIETADAAIREGAVDYLIKPFTAAQLRLVVGRSLGQRQLREENRWLRRQLARSLAIGGIVGASPAMQELSRLITRVARTTASVLVLGETGTGKSLVARAIHAESPRRDGPFIQVDCGSFPEHLLESELFGHEKGAFTGAHEAKQGLLECAEGGTFFLDEICELSLPLQAKMLGVLQDRCFRHVGGRNLVNVDVRFLAATNRDIEARVAAGEFREDLFYRLNVIQLKVPPLRDRLEDIPVLATHFLECFNRRNGAMIQSITPRTLARLQTYEWPGNVRQLENVIERAASLTAHDLIDVEDLPAEIGGAVSTDGDEGTSSFAAAREEHLRRFERAYLENLLKETNGNVMVAAVRARLPRTTMYRYLDKFNLVPRSFRE